MTVQILGNGAGGPFQGRNYTAQLVQAGKHRFLVDCGEGAQQQIYRYGAKVDRCDQIFISHLHGDHVFGLVGLITSFCIKKRERPLTLFSPPGLRGLLESTFAHCGVITPFEIEYTEVDASRKEKVFENGIVEVYSLPLNHRMPCSGWLFVEKPRLPNMRKEQIEAYDIPFTAIPGIKSGGDYTLPGGKVIPHVELVTPPDPPVSYAFCSDTAFSEALIEAVRGVDLLYHEATFLNEHLEEARIAFHSTAAQAAEVAQKAGVGKLLMGHFSARYKRLDAHLSEARDLFAESYLAEEGEVYAVGKIT